MDLDKLVEMRVGDQTIRCDRNRTQYVYSTIEKGGADECGCIYCQNFAAQRDSAYPDSFKLLLDRLGIDPAKEGEAYEIGPIDGGKFSYGGWLYFTGEMIEAGTKNTTLDAFEFWFTTKCPDAPAFHGGPLLAVEFLTAINWVLAVRPE
jgi:hypothetical protein